MDDRFVVSSPHNVIKHLETSINKATKNITNNQYLDATLYEISKNVVSAVLSILEIQDKITRITKEALDASGKNKRINAIETRRILDYISRTLSNNILKETKESTEYELHHLVYGLAQIATETSIVAALKDTTFAAVMSKKQNIEIQLRKKRSVNSQSQDQALDLSVLPKPSEKSVIYDVILNKTNPVNNFTSISSVNIPIVKSPYDLIKNDQRKSIHIINTKSSPLLKNKGFLNKTTIDGEIRASESSNETSAILLENNLNASVPDPNLEVLLFTSESGFDSADNIDKIHKQLFTDAGVAISINQEIGDGLKNDNKAKDKLDRLESKAKKAILYGGDIAYLTALSVVAMRRALTASIEVHMSVALAKNEMMNHQDLMMNLAKTAAQQVGKEAKIATSKSLACERMLKLALKYTTQSNGAILNHAANRILLNILPLSTLAKSMASVSSDIAINSLYLATDVKPPV